MNLSFRCIAGAALLFLGQAGAEAAVEKFRSQSVQKANFVPGTPSDLFPSPNSQFNGLITSTNGIFPEQCGYFKIIVYPTGYFTGNMLIAGRQISLSGYFSPDGTATTYLYRIFNDDCCYAYYSLAWVIDLVIIPGTDEIQGCVFWVGPGPWVSELLGFRNGPWNSHNPSPFAGRYTVRFPGSVDPAVAPGGDGYTTVSVNSYGYATLSGALANNIRFSRSALISTNGFLPLSIATASGQGIFIGWLTFNPAPARDIFGDAVWIQPPIFNATYYPAGFEGDVRARGGPYLGASSTNSALSWTNGTFRASDGNLPAPIMNSITLSPTGTLTSHGGSISNLTFSLNRNTGVFSGRFRDPQNGRFRNYYGALFQDEDIGGGFFLGSNQGGRVSLQSLP
jgi:hypothetical protein